MLDDAAKRGLLSVRWAPIDDTDAVEAALTGADLLWVESPTNPLLEIADLPALVAAAHRRGTLVAVDNTFATPLLQRPLELGADVVVHSVTKYLSGHSDLVLGATVTRGRGPGAGGCTPPARSTARSRAPSRRWLALRGMRTLPLRVERVGGDGGRAGPPAAGHPALTRVRYPGLPDDPGHARATAQMSGYRLDHLDRDRRRRRGRRTALRQRPACG